MDGCGGQVVAVFYGSFARAGHVIMDYKLGSHIPPGDSSCFVPFGGVAFSIDMFVGSSTGAVMATGDVYAENCDSARRWLRRALM